MRSRKSRNPALVPSLKTSRSSSLRTIHGDTLQLEMGRLKMTNMSFQLEQRTCEMKQPSPKDISIRLARSCDRDRISQLYRESLQMLRADYTQEQIQALLENKKMYEANSWGDVVLVAECRKTIVGFSALMRNTISAMYVHPLWVRQRIGTRLLTAIELEAASRQYKRLFIKASLTAVPFYQSCGYRVLASSSILLSYGAFVPCVDMHKHLRLATVNQQSLAATAGDLQRLLLVLFRIVAVKLLKYLFPRR